MATPQDVANLALALARQFLDLQQEQLGALALEDAETLRLAQEVIRKTNRGPETARAREHIAFALLTAAYREYLPPA